VKVLHWTGGFPSAVDPDDPVARLVQAQRARGLQPVVLASQRRGLTADVEDRNGTPVHRLPLDPPLSLGQAGQPAAAVAAVADLKRRLAADLVHLHGLDGAELHLQTIGVAPAPTVLSAPPAVPGAVPSTVLDRLTRRAGAVTVAADADLDELLALYESLLG